MMNQTIQMKSVALALAGSVLLAGCSGGEALRRDIDSNYAKSAERAEAVKPQIIENRLPARPLVVRKSTPWLGADAVPLARDAKLPDVFQQNVSLVFPGRTNLTTIGERLTKVTGVPVQFNPDVFISPQALMGGGSAAAGGVQQHAAGGDGALSNFDMDTELNFNGPLTGFLDTLCARLGGISWELRDNRLYFFRFVTRSFSVKANPGGTEFASSIGKSGNATAGSQGGQNASSTGAFSSQSNVRLDSKFNFWESFDQGVKTLISPMGKYSLSQATGSLTVTDTREVVERIERFVNHENKVMTRQVAIRVEVISLNATKSSEYGVDWTVAYKNLDQNLATKWGFTLMSPSTLTSAIAGSLALSILQPVASNQSVMQSFNGTKALMNAMSEFGKTELVTSSSVMTLNRQGVPVALTDQVSYLASTTPGTVSASGGGGSPGLTPGTVTTGYMLNLLPVIHDDNTISLQMSIDISNLTKMGSVSAGSGSTLQTIQTPEVSGMQFGQRVSLRPGQTLVLTGFERRNGTYNRRTIAEDGSVGLGGSDTGSDRKESIVLLVTPVIADSI